MDLVFISFKLIIYFIILFVFVFIGINIYLDINKKLYEKSNAEEFEKTEKENKKFKWWGDLIPSNGWDKFFSYNEKKGKVKEGYASQRKFLSNVNEKTFLNNEFQQIILPDVDNYNLEIAIPADQKIYPTVQGNWGFNMDEEGVGFSAGVYRDGQSADGCIFKGISEKRYKYTLERGPYVIRYENRKNKDNKHNVTIFINNKKIIVAKNEGISSGNIKYIGTNDTWLKEKTDSNAKGRRPLDYLKFIPISNQL